MGNCVFKGFRLEVEEMIKVVTTNGGIMELYSPITAEFITNEFPGHAIYRSRDLFSQPLFHNEELQVGQPYYLLPINTNTTSTSNTRNTTTTRNSLSSSTSSSKLTPYRMSFDNQRMWKRSSTEPEVCPRYNSTGVWKVKLVISPEQLAEIMAQETRTEELIESVRTVAKCGNGVSSSLANSDQSSLSSSRKGSLDQKFNRDI
ncbi:PLASTID MOVEMENT IMPAIRED PROTEIN-RELATED [Salix koriyanagi]|uniref:PLASTID MOVEMENT IMPAIRED PROTEIN-RELATED n=1 Tax=Salix koriyanagi TaxID=2511006 RepID=A0A9Q0U4D9_9ROSI|nr:PLASTID MOVEMENT IMPAIRED PROTEIN-RELATED [Salix koriyanagi]